MEEFIRNNLIIINSARTFQELKTFIWKHGRLEAQRGYNDDLVMSLAIAYITSSTTPMMGTERIRLTRQKLMCCLRTRHKAFSSWGPLCLGRWDSSTVEKNELSHQPCISPFGTALIPAARLATSFALNSTRTTVRKR